MGRTFQRHLGLIAELQPSQFCVERTPLLQTPTVFISCHKCGGIDSLDPEFEIGGDGKVTPAWGCPWETCGFFDFITLEGINA